VNGPTLMAAEARLRLERFDRCRARPRALPDSVDPDMTGSPVSPSWAVIASRFVSSMDTRDQVRWPPRCVLRRHYRPEAVFKGDPALQPLHASAATRSRFPLLEQIAPPPRRWLSRHAPA